MSNAAWVSELGDKIFTIVKTRLVNNGIETRYPDVRFVSPNKLYVPSDYPTVWIREIQGIEMGQDLDNVDVNGVSENIQVDVISLDRQTSRKITNEVVVEFKKLRFNIVSLPYPYEDDLKQYCTTRFSRTIGAGDIIG